ncbi:nucleoporin 88 [Pieris rapae]|uniref:nucleoporin 88 n=1 Tax=Pieris rapae TaxID=64459 RepID=UPI001E27D1F4|nr:nucleoporin 88 [Pieris rapae]
MDTRLYETKLAHHKLFKDLKDTFSEYSGAKLRNLIELQDDVLYVWNPIENCLFCVNLKYLEEHGDAKQYQKLHLLSPPAFPVERLSSSDCGTRLCVWGSRGVTIAELPTRWGRGGLFESGNQTVLCKSYSLDERFMYAKGEVHRVRWHPKSLSHLLVLLSDNTMRLYNIALKTGPRMIKSFLIGPKPVGSLGMTLLDSFGDSAVDFTATPDNEHLLILSGNGDVYMMNTDFLDSKSPLQIKLRGPLAIYPPADDNYGSESCTIMTMGAADFSTVVVIASATASLYHCLLLPNGSEKEDGDGYALYVMESVDLNIVLNSKDDVSFAYPVHLYPCLGNTYACVHAGGVHSVTLPIMGHLKDLAVAEENEIDSILSLISSKSSAARHLVCTSSDEASPPVGLVLAPPLHDILVLCSSGELLIRSLEPYIIEENLFRELQLQNPALDSDELHELLKERQKLSFVTIIQEILGREVSQPILHLNKTQDMGPKEMLEMLTEVTVKLREQYILRQSRANSALVSKINALRSLQTQQVAWKEDLQKDIQDVELETALLIEKRNLAEKKQEDIKFRCSSVIRALSSSTIKSPAEQEMMRQLETYKQKSSHLQTQTRSLREHVDKHIQRIKEWEEEYKKKDIALGKSHSDTISSILQQQTNQVASLIEETKLLKDQLGVV